MKITINITDICDRCQHELTEEFQGIGSAEDCIYWLNTTSIAHRVDKTLLCKTCYTEWNEKFRSLEQQAFKSFMSTKED